MTINIAKNLETNKIPQGVMFQERARYRITDFAIKTIVTYVASLAIFYVIGSEDYHWYAFVPTEAYVVSQLPVIPILKKLFGSIVRLPPTVELDTIVTEEFVEEETTFHSPQVDPS